MADEGLDGRILQLIQTLKGREDAMRENISEAATGGNHDDRIHYIGWLRGIEGSRRLVEYLFKKE